MDDKFVDLLEPEDEVKINLFGEPINNINTKKLSKTEKISDECIVISYEHLTKRKKYDEKIDISNREGHLSHEEFEKIMGMTKYDFSKLKNWKKIQLKKKVDLF